MKVLHKVTWKALMNNRTRTWVTIIGIMLSAAMFTAVTTCASSIQYYMMGTAIAQNGAWHGRQLHINQPHVTALQGNPKVKDLLVFEKVGYAPIGSTNEYKPYLSVEAVVGELEGMVPFELTAGRMPKTSNELLIPNHLYANGQVELALGDTLELTLGDRLLNGVVRDQRSAYDPGETFSPRESRTYTVVGFYNRFPYMIEDYSAPGYTALTVSDGAGTYMSNAYIIMKNPWDIYQLLGNTTPHHNLLRTIGISLTSGFNQVLYGLSAILMGIILFGSVSLIYNAFSISVSERTKQFGVLKSVGATKRQIKSSVYFEAVVLSAIGIPLGVLSGILGIGITLHFTQGMFDTILSNGMVRLQLYVSPIGVAIAVLVAFVTVLISARIPAQRAISQNAIDAVRQTADLQIRAKRVRSPRWVYKLFGFAGLLADKNFKRNRKKYRTTVFSLFMSVVLFISASSFCSYLTGTVEQVVSIQNYDLSYTLFLDEMAPDAFNQQLATLEKTQKILCLDRHYQKLTIDDQYLNTDYLAGIREILESQALSFGGTEYQPDRRTDSVMLFVEDQAFSHWAKQQGLDPTFYYDRENIRAIAADRSTSWNTITQRYEPMKVLADANVPYTFQYVPDAMGDHRLTDLRQNDQGEELYIYTDQEGHTMEYTADHPLFRRQGVITHLVQESPLGSTESELTLIFPLSMQAAVTGQTEGGSILHYYFKADDHLGAERELENLLKQLPVSSQSIYNIRSGEESNRALVTVVNVFSYGFIILISLIALANVFNTISTNIALRRREFAMLRSVGMSERALHRMMNYECILYGVKGLSFGLVVAIFVTFLIYWVVNAGVVTRFYIPWYSITAAVLSVFLVVFATMLYAMKKIRGEDPISALKNENL